eukprot:565302-Rhodomonas_salina.1
MQSTRRHGRTGRRAACIHKHLPNCPASPCFSLVGGTAYLEGDSLLLRLDHVKLKAPATARTAPCQKQTSNSKHSGR